MTKTKWLGLSLVLMMLAGCGQSAALPSAPRPYKRAQQPPRQAMPPGMMPGQVMPGQMPGQMGPMGPMGPGGPGQMEGAQMLDQMRRTLQGIRGFDATITSYTQGHYKSGQKVSELRKSTTSARLIWVKPEKLRAEVITATNPLLEGAAMVTTNGKNITARAKGLLGLIPFKLTASDDKLSTNRNHSFTENNPKSHLERLTSPQVTWTVVGQDMVEGVPVKIVKVDGVQHLDHEITDETVAIDPRTLGLKRLTMYAGRTKVVEHTFNKFKWDPKVTGEMFSL